jgi:hypothetical protein
MSSWLVSSKDIENIKVVKEILLWGFWDREAGENKENTGERLSGFLIELSLLILLFFK